MATTKKRIAISLPPELEQALNDLKEATGVSPSSFVAEIMTQSIPMIRGVTEAALEAKNSPSNALRLMQRSMMQALGEVASMQMDLIDQQTALRKSPKATQVKELTSVKPVKAKRPKAKT
jgi:predicted DNA-binding protein